MLVGAQRWWSWSSGSEAQLEVQNLGVIGPWGILHERIRRAITRALWGNINMEAPEKEHLRETISHRFKIYAQWCRSPLLSGEETAMKTRKSFLPLPMENRDQWATGFALSFKKQSLKRRSCKFHKDRYHACLVHCYLLQERGQHVWELNSFWTKLKEEVKADCNKSWAALDGWWWRETNWLWMDCIVLFCFILTTEIQHVKNTESEESMEKKRESKHLLRFHIQPFPELFANFSPNEYLTGWK